MLKVLLVVLPLALVIVGWRVQRIMMPTCGQVADHMSDLFQESHPTEPFSSLGQIRQACIDKDWSRDVKSRVMRADTTKQVTAELAKPE
jgi:hypothetical protein